MSDLISRAAALEALDEINAEIEDGDGFDFEKWRGFFCDLPSVQPTINGYDIRHLELIAAVLQKENLPPERVTEVLTDISRIVAIVAEEFQGGLRKAVEQCMT